MTLHRRVAALEELKLPRITDVRLASTRDLSRVLAQWPVPQLRRELPGLSGADFGALVEEIREHVPGYGVTA